MRRSTIPHLLAATLTVLSVGACAAPMMQSSGGAPWALQSQGDMATRPGQPGLFGLRPLLRNLELSADQKKAIQDIVRANRQGRDGTQRQAMQDLRAALLAPSVDAAKLESQLQQLQAKRSDALDRNVSLAVKVREVLTPAQREKAASLQPPKTNGRHRFAGKFAGKPLERLLQGLTLTEVQQQALGNLKAALERQRDSRSGRRDQMHQAFATFARTGDAVALRQALADQAPNPPIHEVAVLAASLDQSQRQQIANRMREMRQRGQGRHAGHRHEQSRSGK
jgi:Spy/CpxP family protein refolding chaperone